MKKFVVVNEKNEKISPALSEEEADKIQQTKIEENCKRNVKENLVVKEYLEG